ncbi:hypothetical protein GCM10011344_01190 [Dokdonia pacifica]|uniref:Uncharacterized protein n=1 Tax=Dokdonia pacifica TaxID=1627892 RepID=A0A239CZ17_9FLAO|nr:DUF6638 family protein [Dokdonia pacifica]GGG04567.1 hypothetical protein GCM10011344_01190 [Dokdonia pacifica]SNS24593.1 hypothetical protein SAMN06265376_10921 [Dokdonia pacifica]
MKKLKEAGLYGGALVPVSGSLAQRYNECLAMLGVAPTALTNFAIDAMGWSPEIATEKGENYYLNIGEANTNAIIISPEQRYKPVHMPSHSFDRDLMEAVFAANNRIIRDITKDAAICVHIDQKIDAFYEPFDLLRYDTITVTFDILNQLDVKQAEQNELIATFQEGNNFINRELHKKLIENAKKYGDLRHRKLTIDPLPLKVSSFYTRAFGGVFVLKDFITDIMIFEDKAVFDKAITDTGHDVALFHKDHDELIDKLVKDFIIDNDLKKASKSKRFDRIKKHRFMEHSKEATHSFVEILDSHFLFKKYITSLDIEVQKQLNGVELFFQKSIINKEIKQEDYIDTVYYKALHQPHSSLEEEQAELIWKLLIKMQPIDPLHLYWYDKAQFYEAYQTWPDTYQDWVIQGILEENS